MKEETFESSPSNHNCLEYLQHFGDEDSSDYYCRICDRHFVKTQDGFKSIREVLRREYCGSENTAFGSDGKYCRNCKKLDWLL